MSFTIVEAELDLPQYSPRVRRSASRRQRTTHQYALSCGTFKLFSRASSPGTTPVFIEGDIICGSLEVEAGKLESIAEIIVTVSFNAVACVLLLSHSAVQVEGRIISSGRSKVTSHDSHIFLKYPQTAYSKPSFNGSHQILQKFPISLTLPRDVEVLDVISKTPRIFRLPPSFSDRTTAIGVSYTLSVTIRRGRFRLNEG
jgi:hypothetical protein